MKRTKSFSLYAFIIALLVHIIILLVLILLDQFKPAIPPQPKPDEPQEERFKLSIKERPTPAKESLVKNDIPKVTPKRSIPRGEQLIKEAQPLPKPQRQKSVASEVKPVAPAPEPLPEPKKAFERHVAKTVADIERKPIPKKEQGLYDILSKADPSAQDQPVKSSTKLTDSIQRLYGDKFNQLSEGEQKYILDNQEVMRRITQSVLDRYGHSRIPDNIRINDTNMVEFYLHPDGSISDMRLLKNSQLSILDDTTREVIELAYAKYPRPQQKTLIRYRVWYNLTGY
ncbi:TonB family protein [Sulfuricurvum kujiense DSM 16994]|uniref:TonB family protein n=1 Tax=Sulfuricurvum kujiense (strain ATCC BAA-921 / DSM 16994 / JCM 11577 / YK-1) TaxID=709032 RepID=E4TZW0_SULKY|nr:energy transducer TonB [Sulfuricurvum kujiense]ADR34217.1 TonB family protein [Sulfuricurvum kujiense DSM 16994]